MNFTLWFTQISFILQMILVFTIPIIAIFISLYCFAKGSINTAIKILITDTIITISLVYIFAKYVLNYFV